MNKHWAKVLIAAVFEVMWVIGLKHSNDPWSWLGTAAAVYISFYIMIRAAKHLPVGTVYAVFVGLGTTGTVLSEILFFDKPVDHVKLILIGTLLVGVIGLKMVTPDTDTSKGAESS